MEKMNEICKMILTLNEEDYANAAEVINSQKAYVNPLRMATQGWQNELGRYNAKVVEKIKELHELLKTGTNIERP